MTIGDRLARPGLRTQLRMVRGLFADPTTVLDEIGAQHGGLLGLGWGPVRMAIVGDPAAINELHRTANSSFRWNHKFNVLGFVVGKNSMIVSDGDAHRRRRGAVTPGFGRRRLNGWIPMIVEQADVAIDSVVAECRDDAPPIDLYPVVRELVLGVVVRAMFGERMVARLDEISELFQRPQAYLESPFVRQLPNPLPFSRRARVRRDRRALDAIIDGEIEHHRNHPDDDPRDVLATLVRAGELSGDEIRDQVATLIGAGYDTTAASMSWMLWCATTHPGLWDRLRVEADEAFAGGEIDASLLQRLPLADRVMRETLRLHPAGVVAPRESATDVVVGGGRIPRGTLILWSPYLAGRDARVWTDPLRFDPDRLDELSATQRNTADLGWVPFGGGARNCIGFALAQMELTIIVSRLAQRLALTPPATTIPRPRGLVVNRPTGGAPMFVRPMAAAPG